MNKKSFNVTITDCAIRDQFPLYILRDHHRRSKIRFVRFNSVVNGGSEYIYATESGGTSSTRFIATVENPSRDDLCRMLKYGASIPLEELPLTSLECWIDDELTFRYRRIDPATEAPEPVKKLTKEIFMNRYGHLLATFDGADGNGDFIYMAQFNPPISVEVGVVHVNEAGDVICETTPPPNSNEIFIVIDSQAVEQILRHGNMIPVKFLPIVFAAVVDAETEQMLYYYGKFWNITREHSEDTNE